MKNHTLSLLCACAFFSFSGLHASDTKKALLDGIECYDKTEVSKSIDLLGDEMRQAILDAGFVPSLRHQVIINAQNATPDRMPLLGAALLPFSTETIFHDRVTKAMQLPIPMLQALAEAPLTQDLLRFILNDINSVTPAHIKPLAAFCEGMDHLYLNEKLGRQFSKVVVKTPEEIAAVVNFRLDPLYRMAVLENNALFPEEKRPALRRLLEGQVRYGLKTLQAALPHDAQTLTKYADQGFEPDHRAAFLRTNILGLAPEHLDLAKKFLCGIRIESHINYAAQKVVSTSSDNLLRVVNGNFSPPDRCSILEYIQDLSPNQLAPLKKLLESKPQERPDFPFTPSLIVKRAAAQHHTPEILYTLCDAFFTRTSAGIILGQDTESVVPKIPLLRELQLLRKQVEDFNVDIYMMLEVKRSVEQLQTMLACSRLIVQTPMQQYQQAAFLHVLEALQPDQIAPIAALLRNVPHHSCDGKEFIYRAVKLSNERLELIAGADFHPIHIAFVMKHLSDVDPALYPVAKSLLSKVSLAYDAIRTGEIDAAVHKIREQLQKTQVPLTAGSSLAQGGA